MKKVTLAILGTMLYIGVYAATPQAINISTNDVSLILKVAPSGDVELQHFGGKIADADQFCAKQTNRRQDYSVEHNAYTASGGKNFTEAALRVTHADGDINTELKYVSHEQKDNGNIAVTEITLADQKTSMQVKVVYTAYKKENVITTHSQITNREKGDITLHNYASSSLSLKASKYLLTHFYGSWAREMQIDHTLLTHGTKSIESRKEVRTTHTENPSFMLSLDTESFDENHGEVVAGALAWSGNFKLNFEVDEFDVLNITCGINPYAADYKLAKGASFTTPEMVYTYSTTGCGGATRNLHDWARNYGIHNTFGGCPTLLNSWEGAYFKFNAKTLTDMIDDAKSMGLEMFVLDDGWFGNKYPRDNDKAGLGDWQLNAKKLPEGIDYIATYAHSKGLKFGIWIEPEMVNPKSELAERHPEWVVKAVGRDVPTERNQWLLDLSNPKVQDFVFEVFDNTIKLSKNIDYIKWDANRHVESVGSEYLPTDKQTHFWVDYAQGFYKVCERIRQKYPNIMVQACASGGGRVEYGALKYFDEVWTSDNTESLSRIFIQYGTNMIYPAMVTGSHVSAVPNHQTRNITPLKFRFDVASAGRLGMELQPKSMTDEEQQFARRAIASFKEYRDIVYFGDLYRIASPYDDKGFYAMMYVSKDKKRAVVFGYCIKYQSRTLMPKFRLNGLDAERSYKLTELNNDKSKFWANGKVLGGDFLMQEGINPPLVKLYDSAIYLLEAE